MPAGKAPVAMIGAEAWRRLERLSRQLSRRRDEADDLLQDVMLAALEAGRGDEPWLHGVMRRRAAFLARGAARRMRREAIAGESILALAGSNDGRDAPAGMDRCDPALLALLARLPPASRRVLLLALHGLGAGEVQWLLRITPAAFRQRLATIRRALRNLPGTLRSRLEDAVPPRSHVGTGDARFGLRRRHLVLAGRRVSAAGSHDPDGHLLLFRSHARMRAHVPAPHGNQRSDGAGGRSMADAFPRDAGIP